MPPSPSRERIWYRPSVRGSIDGGSVATGAPAGRSPERSGPGGGLAAPEDRPPHQPDVLAQNVELVRERERRPDPGRGGGRAAAPPPPGPGGPRRATPPAAARPDRGATPPRET